MLLDREKRAQPIKTIAFRFFLNWEIFFVESGFFRSSFPRYYSSNAGKKKKKEIMSLLSIALFLFSRFHCVFSDLMYFFGEGIVVVL
jgi:hypothetical protein